MNDTERYNDIIGLPYRKSKKHPPMSEGDRAAQFSPFAALKGYEDEIEEAARFVDGRLELDESRVNAINDLLVLLKAKVHECPTVRVTYFRSDARKEGGEFITLSGKCRRIDEFKRTLFVGEVGIPFDDIVDLEHIPVSS